MKIGITGVTGLIGRHLATVLLDEGHEIVGFSRRQREARGPVTEFRPFPVDGAPDLAGLDGLIHLAGEPILGVWTGRKRRAIRDSRVLSTKAIVAQLKQMDVPPSVFLCGSATGFYGDRGDEDLTESAGVGEGFLASVVNEWESAAVEAGEATRVALLRTGVVLARDGGALPLMGRAFKFGLGGRLGDGKQWMPWIHIDDVVGIAKAALTDDRYRGAVNAASPGPVRNGDFTGALGSVLGRPTLLHTPAFALRLALRDMSEMLLFSQRALPKVAQDAGYEFRHTGVEGGLRSLL